MNKSIAQRFWVLSVFVILVLFSNELAVSAEDKIRLQKVVAPSALLTEKEKEIELIQNYGSFSLYRVSEAALKGLSAKVRAQIRITDEMDTILLDAYPFNTQTDTLDVPAQLKIAGAQDKALHLIQFVGPIKAEWLQAVEETGAALVHYIANNAYLIWSDSTSRARLDILADSEGFIQYSGLYEPYFKYGSSLRTRALQQKDANQAVRVTIQIYNHEQKATSQQIIDNLTLKELVPWHAILDYQNITVTIPAGDLATIAQLPDVYWIGEYYDRELFDEVQGQLVAGNFNGPKTGPSAPGYLSWLDSHGFSMNQNDYPIVDVTDDGIGNGTVNSGDFTLHRFGNISNPTRLAYVDNCTFAANGGGLDGHGHINISIAGGYDTTSGFPYRDPNGFQRGMGINPYGRFAGTRVFAPFFNLSNCGGTDAGLIKSIQDNGAKISNNSWGCSDCAGLYDDSSQAFDAGVRDADPIQPGNQEMIFVFSAGNSGPSSGTIGSPGNGKNMITVGASENFRQSDEDGFWFDGCGIGPAGADNAMDVISFSSRGPSPGNRVKPELIGPGTHIQGTASTNASYNGFSVCDQFRPSGQAIFAASSGTSHSAPAVAGISSLAYWWMQNTFSITPSPAMTKAYLMAHTTYLTGASANDTLPSNRQGYGMPNMSTMFDDTSKFLLDQSHTFNNTGEMWTWTGSVVDPSKPARIVLAYTDAPGAIGTSPQVNNLNLAVNNGGNTYLGNVFSNQWSIPGGAADPYNNYEAVFLPPGTTGSIGITITAFNIAGDGIPNSGDMTDQDFGLICYNCAVQDGVFVDVPPGYWAEDYIYAIYDAGYTTGCSQNPLKYCPLDPVSRDQMAAFIVRAKEGEPPADYCATGSPFSDVSPDTWPCKYIKRLSELGITQGCGPGIYCPDRDVTRAEMAAFLVRAVEGEPPADYCATGSPFSDVSSDTWPCKYIKRLLELEITKGCGPGVYCPNDPVTRDQMAAFLARAFLDME